MLSEKTKYELNQGYIRGAVGKEEDTSMARIINSPQPLPNELAGLKKAYFIGWGVLSLGLLLESDIWAIGFFILIIIGSIDSVRTENKINRLRLSKFIASPKMSYDDMYMNLQPILISKYGMQTERREDGVFTVQFNGTLYDVLLHEDMTFTLWWREELSVKSFLPSSRYKHYKQILTTMGIIAFEIQNYYGINNQQAYINGSKG